MMALNRTTITKYIRCLLGMTNKFEFKKSEKARMDTEYNDARTIKICPDVDFSLYCANIDRVASPLFF